MSKLPPGPFWHLGNEEDFVSTDQWLHWQAATEATEQTWADDPKHTAKLERRHGCRFSQPVKGRA